MLGADDATFRTEIDQHIDFGGYLTQYALSALLFHWDGYEYNTNNYMMYNNPADSRFVFWLHGLDQLFYDCGWPIDDFPFGGGGLIPQRIQSDPLLQQQYHQKVGQVLDEVWNTPELLSFLDSAVAVYQEAAERDPTRGFDVGRFQSVRSCIAARPDNVRQQLNAVCGDGNTEGSEQCDDGNTAIDDGCSATCRLECGDGVLQPLEQCDDGNRSNNDGCDSQCNLEPQCGDGIVQANLNEQCDDASNGDNFSDGCRDDCTQNICGDLLLDAGEGCDDGNQTPGDGCDTTCRDEDATQTCGNGLLEIGEQCDDGNADDADACDNNCQRPCTGGDAQAVSSVNGHCYIAFESGDTWQGAQDFCVARGGHLVTISSPSENQLVSSLSFAPWIGANDIDLEDIDNGILGDEFVWVTGEAFTFNAWFNGEPNDFFGDEDCGRMEGLQWNDLDCDAGSAFVCELE